MRVVGLGMCNDSQGDGAPGTRLVVNDEGLAHLPRHMLQNCAHHDIGSRACIERHKYLNGLIEIGAALHHDY